jgi:hypothetical protein
MQSKQKGAAVLLRKQLLAELRVFGISFFIPKTPKE